MKRYLFLLLLALTACKKSPKNEPAPPVTKPVLLAGETIVYPGTPDSLIYNYTYSYNTDYRLTNIQLSGVNSPFTYNAQGLLTSYGSTGPGQVLLTVQYDQNNNLLSSTLNSYDEQSHVVQSSYYTFTITSGLVTQIKQFTNLGGSLQYSYDLTYDSNNNLIKRVKLNSDGSLYGTDTFTFGTHYSPNYTDHIKFNFSFILDDDYFNKNEKLTQVSVINNYQTTNFTFQYTYTGLFPTSMIISANGINNYYSYKYINLNN